MTPYIIMRFIKKNLLSLAVRIIAFFRGEPENEAIQVAISYEIKLLLQCPVQN